jgi:hypothetical protein
MPLFIFFKKALYKGRFLSDCGQISRMGRLDKLAARNSGCIRFYLIFFKFHETKSFG